jgi:hypothetical protein
VFFSGVLVSGLFFRALSFAFFMFGLEPLGGVLLAKVALKVFLSPGDLLLKAERVSFGDVCEFEVVRLL